MRSNLNKFEYVQRGGATGALYKDGGRTLCGKDIPSVDRLTDRHTTENITFATSLAVGVAIAFCLRLKIDECKRVPHLYGWG